IDEAQARFIDAFLLYCALEDSPLLENGECSSCTSNFLKVVKEGRRPGLHLQKGKQQVEPKVWASELLERILPLAELLDRSQGRGVHVEALAQQQAKVADAEMTPSAQILAILRQGQSFTDFALQQSLRHAEYFRAQPLSAQKQQVFEKAAHVSLAEQAELEAQPRGDFDAFVAAYQASILALAV